MVTRGEVAMASVAMVLTEEVGIVVVVGAVSEVAMVVGNGSFPHLFA
jgi:hypothetical protein